MSRANLEFQQHFALGDLDGQTLVYAARCEYTDGTSLRDAHVRCILKCVNRTRSVLNFQQSLFCDWIAAVDEEGTVKAHLEKVLVFSTKHDITKVSALASLWPKQNKL